MKLFIRLVVSILIQSLEIRQNVRQRVLRAFSLNIYNDENIWTFFCLFGRLSIHSEQTSIDLVLTVWLK